MSERLVSDNLWSFVAPALPSFSSRPQGGGTAPTNARTVFTAVVFVLTSDCAWRHLPQTFGISQATAHRHFRMWSKAGLWNHLDLLLTETDGTEDIDDHSWARTIVVAALSRTAHPAADR
ncbi:transposase [Kribbella antibiotica]|uniref:transposase n=1 Tax=Kribbella antibiotica TaxID=190195 RepID=UPI0014044698|nr:transposase [Kribbella antibiotica]